MTMPWQRQVNRSDRDGKIYRLVKQGVPRELLTQRFGISRTHIRVILVRQKRAQEQQS